ncbi:sulfite exporter TauE/SafE family protein [Flavobacteriaceae bacterium]|nr:sulfite exporter TauE/SafE family protein [Flavobacteriaceae bacterium]
MTTSILLLLALTGLLAGILSGLVGIGGGIIMVPLFVYLLGFTQHGAQGLSLAIMLPPVTLFAVYNYHKAEGIDWRYATIVAIVFIVGGFFGSKIAINLNQVVLKKVFGFVMLIAALKMIFFSK